MNPNGHPVHLVLYILGIGLAECVIFAAVYGLVRVRIRFFPAPPPPATITRSSEPKSDSTVSAWDDIDIESAIPVSDSASLEKGAGPEAKFEF